MRVQNFRFYLAFAALAFTILILSSAASEVNEAKIRIRVIESSTNTNITNAIVNITIAISAQNPPFTVPYVESDQRYVSLQNFVDNSRIIIAASAPGYSQNQTEIIVEAESSGFVDLTLELKPTGVNWFVEDELLKDTEECGAGYTKKGNFTDKDGKNVRHCVKTSVFKAGDQFVIDSYIQEFLNNEEECPQGGDDYTKQGSNFKGNDTATYYLCVKKADVDSLEDDQVIKDAEIRLNTDSCQSGFEKSGEKIQTTDSEYIIHCVSIENEIPPEEEEDDCEITDVFWSDENRDILDEYFVGEAEPKIYLFAYTNLDCEDEEMDFDVLINGESTDTSFTNVNKNKETAQDRIAWWYEWSSGPEWPEQAPGTPITSVEYTFTAKIQDKEITETSDVLQVFPEKPACTSSTQCEAGEVCKNGECVEGGDCTITNTRWTKDQAILTEESVIRGWVLGDATFGPGEYVNMIADGTNGCFADNAEIKFTVYEDDLAFDDLVSEITQLSTQGGFLYSPSYQLPWKPEFLTIFGLDTVKYYFVAEVSGTDIKSQSISIPVKEPNPAGYCETNDECTEQGENFVCGATSHTCVDNTVHPCGLEEAEWLKWDFSSIPDKMKGYETEAEKEETEPVLLLVKKVENVEGACEGKTIEFEISEIDYYDGTAIQTFDEDTDAIFDRAEDTISELTDYTRDEIAIALWQPKWSDESKDSGETGENEYIFRARVKGTEAKDTSPQLRVYLREPTSTTSESDGGDSGIDTETAISTASQLASLFH